ncbi:MAG: hypothetical protein GXY91_03065 [Clostridia bacterium]|nr:hypothetical protein [Clostridia bacterium]
MKYKNPKYRKIRNCFPLEVSCGSCKTPILIYAKGGKGNLIKLQTPRIIESEVNLEEHEGNLFCINCKEELAKKGKYNGNVTYWIIRGKVNSRRLNNY